MFLQNLGATSYYETLVQHVTLKHRVSMLLRNFGATSYYETLAQHATLKLRVSILLRNFGEKGFSKTSVPTDWSTAGCRKTESKNVNLILRENLTFYWSVKLI